VVDILPERPAAQTGSELFGFLGIVSLDSEYAVVLDVQSNRASAAAVESGCGADDFYAVVGLLIVCSTHYLLLVVRLVKFYDLVFRKYVDKSEP
jgi:hypothetical protein